MDLTARPPRRGPLLYEGLFGAGDRELALAKLSDGIAFIIGNARRLLSDVDLLVSNGRLSSARFLVTTAKEELGKAYLLLDMCRLDLTKHRSVLKRLSDVFYVHEAKQAYFNTLQFSSLSSLDHARQCWEDEVVRWFPSGGPESSEPDMPHSSYFDRELPLYVDYSNYDDDWTVPSASYDSHYFEESLGSSRATEVQAVREHFTGAIEEGLLTADSLRDLNDEFSGRFFTEPPRTRTFIERTATSRLASKPD